MSWQIYTSKYFIGEICYLLVNLCYFFTALLKVVFISEGGLKDYLLILCLGDKIF